MAPSRRAGSLDDAPSNPSFKECTTITSSISPNRYHANIPDHWKIGQVPHGGFVTSLFQRVATLHAGRTTSLNQTPHVHALHLSFLRRTRVGPATFEVQVLKAGRTTSELQIGLRQPGPAAEPPQDGDQSPLLVVGIVHLIDLEKGTGISLPTAQSLHPPPKPANLPRLLQDGEDDNWIELANGGGIPEFSAFRRAVRNVTFWVPKGKSFGSEAPIPAIAEAAEGDEPEEPPSYLDEYLAFSPDPRTGHRERLDDDSLGMAVDMFPVLIEAYRGTKWWPAADMPDGEKIPLFWYPTLILNMEIKKLAPPEGWEALFLRVRTREVKMGRMDLEVCVLDGEGDFVALSNHVCLIVDGKRNTAGRESRL